MFRRAAGDSVKTLSGGPAGRSEQLQEFFTQSAEAYGFGLSLALDDCCYGPLHNKPEFKSTPCEYYYYLAGLVALRRCRRILEIGTHYGGSIRSMMRGIDLSDRQSARVATVDTEQLNEAGFQSLPDSRITRFCGDALQPAVIGDICDHFGSSEIDLLYLDAVHEYEHTLACFETYSARLRPKLIVFDDICLSPGMRKLWRHLKKRFGDAAVDVAADAHRLASAGFGAVLMSDTRGS